MSRVAFEWTFFKTNPGNYLQYCPLVSDPICACVASDRLVWTLEDILIARALGLIDMLMLNDHGVGFVHDETLVNVIFYSVPRDQSSLVSGTSIGCVKQHRVLLRLVRV